MDQLSGFELKATCLKCGHIFYNYAEINILKEHRRKCQLSEHVLRQPVFNESKKRKADFEENVGSSGNKNASIVNEEDNAADKIIRDKALGRFFFGCNIPFLTVESKHFKNFVSELNPNYIPPSRKMLSNSILDSIHKEMVMERINILTDTESILLIDGWKNSSANTKNVVCCMYNGSKQRLFFLESYDLTGISETAVALEEVTNKAVLLAKELYQTNVYAVVSDNASPMMAMGRLIQLWHTTCSSHSGNLLAKSLVDIEFAKKVNSLLKEFKSPSLEKALKEIGGSKMILAGDTRWCSNRDSFRCALKNLEKMRTLVRNGNVTISERNKELLFDENFEVLLQDYLLIFDPVCELVNACQKSSANIADAAEWWMSLNIPTNNDKYHATIEARIKKAVHPIALAANLLHPRYQGLKQSNEQRTVAENFIKENLNEIGLQEFEMYKRRSGIFDKLLAKNITNEKAFWSFGKGRAPNLSDLATREIQIPTSTADLERLFSNWAYIHSSIRNRLSSIKSKKLVDVYYTLKYIDDI